MEKLFRRKNGILLCLVLICSLACAVQGDNLSPLSTITASGGQLTSLTYAGTTYVVADGDLTTGTTTRWYLAGGVETLWVDGAPAPAATVTGTSDPKIGDTGVKADDFIFNIGTANHISSLDGIDFQETIFPYRSKMFFVFERGGNDNGSVQAILPGGQLGPALTLTANGAPYGNTGVAVNGSNAFGYVLQTDVPVVGLRITASGHDALSISIPTRNVWPVAINPLPDQKNVPATLLFEWTLEGEVMLDRYFLYLDEDPALIAEPNALNAGAYAIFGMEVVPAAAADPYASTLISNIAEETVYYWRIDTQILEPNETDPNSGSFETSIIEGPVWRFEGVSNTPEITTQPQDQYVLPDPDTHEWPLDAQAVFTVGFSAGKPVKSYEWMKNGMPLIVDGAKYVATSDVTNPAASLTMLIINNVVDADKGSYSVKITLETATQGSVMSDAAALYVVSDILVHRWSFNGDLSDAIRGADAVIVDPDDENISLVAGELVFGGRMAAGDNMSSGDPNLHYVDLPNGIISALGNHATFAVWFTRDAALGQDTWARLLDFGLPTPDAAHPTPESLEGVSKAGNAEATYIIMTPSPARFQGHGPGETVFINGGTQPAGEEICMIGSWDNGSYDLYINGVKVNSTPQVANMKLSDINDLNNWIGRSQWIDPLFRGSVNELRIYGIPMTAEWAKAIYEAGPDGEAVNLNPCMTPKAFDYNNDCVVDMADFAIFAARWLDCGLLICN
ncbi:MAG: hypothetical protein IH624_11550 [Phycisphaerae bacterium]|nr:hypothetical protein [Phycisphaerae bacterium]